MTEDKPVDPKKSKGPEKWEIENWARTLMDAEEIKADASKMKHVQPLLAGKVKAIEGIRSLADLRAKAKEVESAEEDMDDEDED